MAGTFDLGVMLAEPQLSVDYKRAAEVDAQIKQSAMQAQQNLYDMAMGFKKMRDEKLYTALGYQNFGDYCENETGMKRSNVYNYITVVEKLPQDFVQSIGQSVGMTKLQLLTTLDEEQRTEIVETTDLESTSVRELKEKIKELEKEKEDLQAECILSDTRRVTEKEQLEKRIDTLSKASKVAQKDIEQLSHERAELEKQIAELESRPVEVTVQENDEDKAEISCLKAEIARLEAETERLESEAAEPVSTIAIERDMKLGIEFDMKLKAAKQAVQTVLLCALNSGDAFLQEKAHSQLTELIKAFEFSIPGKSFEKGGN